MKPAAGTALEHKSLVTGATIEDVALEAAAAVAPGDSSIAGFVGGSQNVLLKRVSLFFARSDGHSS